jgi:hypothetical protein
MGSDGTNGAPADVPTTSDAQESHGLAPKTPAKEKKTAEELEGRWLTAKYVVD